MSDPRLIVVEFGARRQKLTLTDRRISTSKLLQLIGNKFSIKLDPNSVYTLQMFNKTFNDFCSLYDEMQTFDVYHDIEPLHRFRIINKSDESQKHQLLSNIQSTFGKIHRVTRDINIIQNLVDTLNQNCDTLNQLMDTHCTKSSIGQSSSSSAYLIDPSQIQLNKESPQKSDTADFDDENFDSVSCYDGIASHTKQNQKISPMNKNSIREQIFVEDENIQKRIIPCKHAVRGQCHMGDQCPYSHDEICIRSVRQWERRS